MSLINDMLKNLEKRFEGAEAAFSSHHVDLQEERSLFFKALIFALVIVMVCALAWFAYNYFHTRSPKKTEAAHLSPAVAPIAVAGGVANPAFQAPVPPPPKIANGITINDLPNQTELTIALSSAPTYLTATDPATNTVTLTLDNTYLSMQQVCQQLNASPTCTTSNDIPLGFQGTAITNIHISKNDGQSLALAIQLAPNASLKSSQLLLTPIALKLSFDKTSDTGITPATSTPSTLEAIADGPTDGGGMLEPVPPKKMIDTSTPYHTINDYIAQQRYLEAQKLLDRLPEKDKNSSQGVMSQAKIYLGEGDNEAALRVLESVPYENQSANFYALYGATLEFNQKHAEAVGVYKKLVDYWPNNPEWWLGLGIAALNNHEDAMAYYAFHHVQSVENLSPEVKQFVNDKLEQLSIESHGHVGTSVE